MNDRLKSIFMLTKITKHPVDPGCVAYRECKSAQMHIYLLFFFVCVLPLRMRADDFSSHFSFVFQIVFTLHSFFLCCVMCWMLIYYVVHMKIERMLQHVHLFQFKKLASNVFRAVRIADDLFLSSVFFLFRKWSHWSAFLCTVSFFVKRFFFNCFQFQANFGYISIILISSCGKNRKKSINNRYRCINKRIRFGSGSIQNSMRIHSQFNQNWAIQLKSQYEVILKSSKMLKKMEQLNSYTTL